MRNPVPPFFVQKDALARALQRMLRRQCIFPRSISGPDIDLCRWDCFKVTDVISFLFHLLYPASESMVGAQPKQKGNDLDE